MTRMSLEQLQKLANDALRRAGASALQADATASALVRADAQGLPSHGVSRVPMYIGHMREDRVDGQATPVVRAQRAGTVLVDAACGFAFPACDLAIAEAMRRAKEVGVGVGLVTNSHHFGAAALSLDVVARAGMVGVAMGNSPAAMPAWGGRKPLFGTNPIAAVFPRRGAAPVVIDLSLSEVARGKIMIAAKQDKPIPLGWALDEAGQPTTDAKAALRGSMLPAGGVKGAMLALMVEMLVTTLTGAQFGAEADSFFEDTGNRPRLGQLFLVLDPGAFAGTDTYGERVEALLAAMLADEGTRLPGERRNAAHEEAEAKGIDVPDALLAELRALAGEVVDR
ncbi:Ldh family oxidoreductase [Cupriavidus consociatus]|uniref:Ldh family oxidoreductase n=1 Tax=Cupriavidus consociatus TaxID=2821357 RepID=UPI001AE999DE|nr:MULTISPECIES: Ldh family oxidoreductase [unclassified Cupriavidus]MBP0623334.1 Ldh family oxidoreductase [Cupriavidus sp. LEh25]MDK2660030.1 Ldh family oxidoreductase [Cupriavidus sp. LEh21]